MLTFCQRLVLMFEWETLCAFSLRLPVMSLFAMTKTLVFCVQRDAHPEAWLLFCQVKGAENARAGSPLPRQLLFSNDNPRYSPQP
jgi:hypothetical protein